MGVLIKIKDPEEQVEYYMDWSMTIKGPLSYGCKTKEEFEEYYFQTYPRESKATFEIRMKRVEETGCSALPESGITVELLLIENEAGMRNNRLKLKDLIRLYCKKRKMNGSPKGATWAKKKKE